MQTITHSSSSSSCILRWSSRSFTAVRLRSNAGASFLFLPVKIKVSLPPDTVPPTVLHLFHNRKIMAQADASGGNLTELNSIADFEVVASPNGYISICGFGSLLSERSARSTFPDLKNFRVAQLHGFRCVFAHVAPIFFERGEISSLSVESCVGEFLIVTVFEIKIEEVTNCKLESISPKVPSFLKREEEFRFLAVIPEGLDGMPFSNRAVLCARYSDEEYFQIRCQGSKEIYHERYGRYNIHKIWRDDILPCRIYLRHCVLAAKNLGEEAYSNFLDHTYISDRKTTIWQYLATTGASIMEEEPTESLKTRYGG